MCVVIKAKGSPTKYSYVTLFFARQYISACASFDPSSVCSMQKVLQHVLCLET